MTAGTHDPDALTPATQGGSPLAALRLATGLLQGILLYLIYRSHLHHVWPATAESVFAPMLLVLLIAPVLLISSLGHLSRSQIWRWTGAVILILAALGYFDIWRGADTGTPWAAATTGPQTRFPSPLLLFFSVAGFYIAHALTLAGASEQRWIARYTSYFESGWKLLLQWLLSLLFVGVLWLVLWLGAALFMLLKLDFLKRLLGESWFAIPVLAVSFSCAVHLTDVRPAIVRGIRTLLLVLMSWILPVATLLAGGFLASLPWTGLTPLWATQHAGAVLLSATATLVLLINTAFQNGENPAAVPRLLRGSARIAAWLLLPMVLIALYALSLRVQEYGWTVDRVIAASCLAVAFSYALGYGWAAICRGSWLAQIATVNIVNAFVILAVLLALFSPLADPARLAVASQMQRLASGQVAASKFDFDYLKFEGARYGLAALQDLTHDQGAGSETIRSQARLALAKKNRWLNEALDPANSKLADNLTAWPAGAVLPASFLAARWAGMPAFLPICLTQQGRACDVYFADLDGTGKPALVVIGREANSGSAVLTEDAGGKWRSLGSLPFELAGCAPIRQRLIAGNFRTVAPRLKEIEVGGQRLVPEPAGNRFECRVK